MTNLESLKQYIFAGDGDGVESLTQEAVNSGVPVETILNVYLLPAMGEVGRRYEEGDFFIPEMLLAGRAMQAGMAIVKPLITSQGVKTAGSVVIGTVQGDLHDIGKTLVSMMLEGSGFKVHDLGVDVEPEKFVEEVRTLQPVILAMSAMLTTTLPAMKSTITALEQSGLRDDLIVMVGGAPVTSEFAASIGADGYAEEAFAAAQKAVELVDNA